MARCIAGRRPGRGSLSSLVCSVLKVHWGLGYAGCLISCSSVVAPFYLAAERPKPAASHSWRQDYVDWLCKNADPQNCMSSHQALFRKARGSSMLVSSWPVKTEQVNNAEHKRKNRFWLLRTATKLPLRPWKQHIHMTCRSFHTATWRSRGKRVQWVQCCRSFWCKSSIRQRSTVPARPDRS